jgi:hypothetical protein
VNIFTLSEVNIMSKFSEAVKNPGGFIAQGGSVGSLIKGDFSGKGGYGGGDGGGGGGGDITTYQYDPAVSAQQLSVGQQQQNMAAEQWDMYKDFFMPYEIEAAEANRELLPLITEASKTTLEAQGPVTEEFYRQSLEGVDVGERMDEAGAEVISATRLGEGMRRREMSRYGIDPSSSTYGDWANEAALRTATGVAGARTRAKRIAEDENYRRLGYSLGRGVYQAQVGPQVDPYARAAGSYSGAASTYSSLANRVLGMTGPGDDYNRSGSILGGLVGTGIGAYYGGSLGALAGYDIGSGIGGLT